MTEDDNDKAGVELGVAPWPLARASASETADKYEAAVLSAGVDFFLNIEGVGDAGLIAIGDGIVYDLGGAALVLVVAVVVVGGEGKKRDGRRRAGRRRGRGRSFLGNRRYVFLVRLVSTHHCASTSRRGLLSLKSRFYS